MGNLSEVMCKLADQLRAKGVTEYEGPFEWPSTGSHCRLVLGPLPVTHQATVVETGEPKLEEPRRDDGLTKNQAEDLYWSSGG